MKIGFIPARFQTDELHEGHKSLINRVLAESDKVVILLGCAVPKLSLKNPLDFETRKAMILDLYPNVSVMPIYDNKSDKVWSENLDKVITATTLTIVPQPIGHQTVDVSLHHSRDSFRSHYSGIAPCKEWEAISEDNGSARRAEIAVRAPLAIKAFRTGVIYGATHRYYQALPTVDCFVFNHGDKTILFGKRQDLDELRLIGGFVDPVLDSNFKTAAARELEEETGLKIDIKVFEHLDSFSIDDWRYRGSSDKIITSLFFVDYDGNQIAKANDDIAELIWINIDLLEKCNNDYKTLDFKIAEEHIPLLNAAIDHYRTF